MKFKPGDRVRVIAHDDPGYLGLIGTVVKMCTRNIVTVRLDGLSPIGNKEIRFYEFRFQILNRENPYLQIML
jgi:RNase P/RNase MRP subunit p29